MDTTTTTHAALIDQVIERLVARFHPDQIMLFGVHARGTASTPTNPETALRQGKVLYVRPD
jgi:hypothetical protein